MTYETYPMVDIHTHILPGVDDGADDLRMARVLLLLARQQGIRHVFCTPHSSAYDHDPQRAEAAFRALSENYLGDYPDTRLYRGCEVYCEGPIMDRVLEALDSGRYPTLNDTQYVLMELSKWTTPVDAMECVLALIKRGYRPVLAHMERYCNLINHMGIVDWILEKGGLIQVNVYSLFDEDDADVKNWARRLVRERKAAFLGSDTHTTYFRPVSVEMGLAWLYENVDRAYADEIAWGNAKRFLIGER